MQFNGPVRRVLEGVEHDVCTGANQILCVPRVMRGNRHASVEPGRARQLDQRCTRALLAQTGRMDGHGRDDSFGLRKRQFTGELRVGCVAKFCLKPRSARPFAVQDDFRAVGCTRRPHASTGANGEQKSVPR